MFCIIVFLILGICFGINVLTDPFGVFGDPLMNWYSYNETNNPRVAKIAYLEEENEQYDAYVIGSSSAASYDVKELNEYLDANFYNLFVYGCDTKDYYDFASYILANYSAKYIVLNLGINEANTYDVGQDSLNEQMHALTTNEPMIQFYAKYAFCNPQYSFDKMSSSLKDTELPQVFDVFDVTTGTYDKRVRDVEKIGDMAVYQSTHGNDFYISPDTASLPYIEECVSSVASIRDLCEKYSVELIVILSPVYFGQWEIYDEETLREYKTALAQEVDYWDFSYTSLSYDSRYFYDATHFRNTVGSMVLAEIFGNENVYRPANFGAYVTKENCQAYLDEQFSLSPAIEIDSYTVDVPILMYHHFSEEVTSDTIVSPETFEQHMNAISEAGYTTVMIQDLINYVYHGIDLPENPVLITMDDGYLSNYEIAWPILKRHDLKATIFSIGSTMGNMEFYKDTQYPITPHFSYEQAKEMLASGSIDIQSHSFDMHQWPEYEESGTIRTCMLPLESETESSYIGALQADVEKYDSIRQQELGEGFCAIAYPGGFYSDLVEVLVHEAGIPVTLSTRTDSRNVLVKGHPQSLYALCRMNVTEYTTVDTLLAYLRGR